MESKTKFSVELEAGELFQIHLSLISRSAFVTQMWASCTDPKIQASYEQEIKFLNELAMKIGGFVGAKK